MNVARWQSACWIVGVWMALALPSMAQLETASLSGRVTDSRGAVVPRTVVEAVQENTNIRAKTQTNDEGLYYLPSLHPGSYRIIVSKDGFKQIIQANVKLDVQDAVTLNFSLAVGSVKESMTIYADAPQIRTQDAALSTLITDEQVENMPLNGRSLQSLIMLAPGMLLAPTQVVGFGDTFNPGQFSANGARSYSNYFTLDGVSANAGADTGGSASGFAGAQPALTEAGTTQNLVSIDALQEFRIQTSTYSPEFGRSPGAQIELLSRSGTNTYHGTLSDYLRNDAFDSQDWFEHALGIRKPALRQNDFGGTFGGPVRFAGFNGKDHTFFFFSYEGVRVRQPTFEDDFVPDLNSRQTAVPAIQPFLNAFPLPTGGESDDPFLAGLVPQCPSFTDLCPSGFAQFAAGFSDVSNSDTWSLKLDHHFNDRVSVFGRYTDSTSNGKRRTQANVVSSTQSDKTLTIGATALVSANVLDEVRVNFVRSTADSVNTLDTFGGAVPPPDSLLFPAPFAAFKNSQMFLSLFGDLASSFFFAGTSAANLQRQFNLVDSFSVTKGKHAMKFGVDYRRLFPVVGPSQYQQQLSFTPGSLFLGDLNNDLTQGEVSSLLVQTQRSDLKPVFVNLSLYGQDTWRVTSRLTMTYGLRWEFNPVPHNSNGPDPVALTGLSNPSTFSLAPPGTPIYPTRYNDFAPRLGFAYELNQQPDWQTVIRAGAGVFYDLGSTEVTNTFMSYPLLSTFFLAAAAPGLPDPAYPVPPGDLAPPTPTLDGATFNVYDSNFRLPKTIQWNATIVQALGKGQTLTTAYVGSMGRHLLQVYPYQTPNATINGLVELYRTNSTSDYDALQVEYQRTFGHGLQALASYSWSHAFDNASDDGLFLSQSYRGNSNFDIRQAFSASLSYTVPTWSEKKATRAILSGWGVDAIIHIQTAPPVDITAADAFFTPTGQSFVVRPDIVPGQPIYQHGSVCPSLDFSDLNPVHPCPGGKRINPNAFTTPQEPTPPAPLTTFREGNLGRNVLRGFGLTQADVAFRRNFKLYEQLHMQFRVDAFNIFNHPNFGSVANTLIAPNFGEAGSMYGGGFRGLNPLYQIGGPRSLQLSLKFAF